MKYVTSDPLELQTEYDQDRKSSSGYNSVPVLYLKKGITVVRVLPVHPESPRKVWFREILEHSIKVDGRYTETTCARSVEQPCAVCDKGESLFLTKEEDNIRLADELRPRKKYLFNVIVLSSPDGVGPDKGVHVMKAGKTVKTQLLDLDMDSTCCGDITSVEAGVNVRIERRGDGLNTEYFVRNLPNRSNIQAELAAKGIDLNSMELYNLFTLFPPKPYEAAVKLVSGFQTVPGFPAGPPTPVMLSGTVVATPTSPPVGLGGVEKSLTGTLPRPKINVINMRPAIPEPPTE